MSEVRPKFDVDEVEHWLDQIQTLLTPEEYRRVAPLIQQHRGVMAQVRREGEAPERGSVERQGPNLAAGE